MLVSRDLAQAHEPSTQAELAMESSRANVDLAVYPRSSGMVGKHSSTEPHPAP